MVLLDDILGDRHLAELKFSINRTGMKVFKTELFHLTYAWNMQEGCCTAKTQIILIEMLARHLTPPWSCELQIICINFIAFRRANKISLKLIFL